MNWINRLIDVSVANPEDARRRRLLNILLLGITALILVAIPVTLIIVFMTPVETGERESLTSLLFYYGVMLAGIGVVFAINRYVAGWLASVLFLALFTTLLVFSDTPDQVSDGRSLFVFTIPIFMASVLVRPSAGFLMALVSSLIISFLSLSVEHTPNTPAMLGFFTLALVTWLSASSLENALRDLRLVNEDLDRRVATRTRDLAEALIRVQTESNKSQAILESIADGVVVFDNDGKAVVANAAVSHLLDLATEAIVDKSLEDLMGTNVRDEQRTDLVRQIDETRPISNLKLEWGRRTLSISLARVRGTDAQPQGTVIVFRDFTREAEIERMKSRFVSMTSHELRTPLNAILGYADMIKEGVFGALSIEQRSVVERIVANGKRLLSLVNNLLDQAAIEAGRISINLRPFSVVELTAELHAVMSVLAEHKQLSFDCTVADDLPPMITNDYQRIQQILINLVGNAIKFTEHGSVRVEVARASESTWTLVVRDTGVGIPPDAQQYIFEPFRQVDDPLTRHTSGTGLGLSIVKQLTALLGGEVKLESEVGRGSTFTIALPLMPVQEPIAS